LPESPNDDTILNSIVDEQNDAFRTRVFRIRYARELVELQTMVLFRLKLDALQVCVTQSSQ
jgi:hypothetical protein